MLYRIRLLFVAALLCLLALVGGLARDVSRDKSAPLPFEPSEELVYEGEFSRSLLRRLNVAEMRFTAKRTPASSTDQKTVIPPRLYFTAEATSKGLFSKLFSGLRFRQRIESTVDLSSFTVLQTVKLDEQGKRVRTSEAVFDRQKGQVVWTERDPNEPTREPRVVKSDFKGAVQDVASAIYFLRTQPLTLGKSLELLISDSGRVYRVPVRVGEKKMMKSVLGEVQTIRVEPELFGEGRLIRGKGKISIWLTDDSRRIPVYARITHDMGTLDIKLKSAMNLQTSKKQ